MSEDSTPKHRPDDGVRNGLGCILLVIAVFLFIVLVGTADHLVEYINHWLEAHS